MLCREKSKVPLVGYPCLATCVSQLFVTVTSRPHRNLEEEMFILVQSFRGVNPGTADSIAGEAEYQRSKATQFMATRKQMLKGARDR